MTPSSIDPPISPQDPIQGSICPISIHIPLKRGFLLPKVVFLVAVVWESEPEVIVATFLELAQSRAWRRECQVDWMSEWTEEGGDEAEVVGRSSGKGIFADEGGPRGTDVSLKTVQPMVSALQVTNGGAEYERTVAQSWMVVSDRRKQETRSP